MEKHLPYETSAGKRVIPVPQTRSNYLFLKVSAGIPRKEKYARPRQLFKSWDVTLQTKVCIVKLEFF